MGRFLLSIQQAPSDEMLGSLCEMRIRGSDQLKTRLTLYEQEFEQTNSQPNYQKLQTVVKRGMDQKIRERKLEARNERVETGAPVKARSKGKPVSVEGKQGECYQWKAQGQRTKGNTSSFRHDENKFGKETQSSSLAPKTQTQIDGKNF